MSIVYGLIGLGIIVFVHELGHFIAARLCGVEVETFSVGMGPVLFRKKTAKTEYRFSLLPLGGYCGMKGEHAFQKAIENNLDTIPKEKASFYGVHPLKRAIIAFCGPFSNFLFAILALAIVADIGYSYYTTPNKIILADQIDLNIPNVAREAGLQTGDTILSINGKNTPYFADIYQEISLNAKQLLTLEIERNQQPVTISITPSLDAETGAGKIGITNWINPIISSTTENSGASAIGLVNDDIIISIDGTAIHNTIDVRKALQNKTTINLSWIRNEVIMSAPLTLTNGQAGITFKVEKIHTPKYTVFEALGHGVIDAINMFSITVKSMELLFKGINLTKAVSGPVRITVMLGKSAQEGFAAGFSTGVIAVCNFLAIISISLFLMNLLPIPILDGGLILFAIIEWIRKKQTRPKTLYKVQFIGIAFIAFIFIFALFGDIRYLITGN